LVKWEIKEVFGMKNSNIFCSTHKIEFEINSSIKHACSVAAGCCLALPVIALLTCKTFQMVNVTSGAHHHFKCRNHFVAGRTEAGIAE